MKPALFAYHRAHSVAEAVALLAELGDEAKILAGGLSLVPMMNFRLARPTALVDVTRIEGLSYLKTDPRDGLRVGALTTHGRAINPMLVEGQLIGGVAQGIGGALFEEFSYDDAGQSQAITFIEYRIPTAAEIPPVDVLLAQDAPSPGNPLGVMGAGEGGANAVGAAVANAVRDALGLAGGIGQLPLTPARVRALADRRGGAA